MRVPAVEEGDGLLRRLLIRFISWVSGMRLPDAARLVLYHRAFYGRPMTAWTNAAMRGESRWPVGDRELMAAMVAKWNECPFCIDAHGSMAALELGDHLVNAVLEDPLRADISAGFRATLSFLKKLSLSPDELSVADAQAVLAGTVTPEALEDAIAVAALFGVTVRCASALDFQLLDSGDSARAAARMLKRGYEFGKGTVHGHADHHRLAEDLRQSILQVPASTEVALRQAIMERIAGGPPLEAPLDELVMHISRAPYKVTDALVDRVVRELGNEKAAFEVIVTAAVSAGLYRWDKGSGLLKEAVHPDS
jgi:uncharacterized peroxidase-related enzyme